MLPDISGLKVLERLREIDPEITVVMLTAFASVETAVTAIKCGAFDYLTKPFKNDEVLQSRRKRSAPATPCAREPFAQGTTRPSRAVRRTGREVTAHAGGVLTRRTGRRIQVQRADHRRERHREGTGRESDPSSQPAQETPLRHRPLRKPPARIAREQPLRSSQGSVHRRGGAQEGPFRDCRRRQHLLRRDRHPCTWTRRRSCSG